MTSPETKDKCLRYEEALKRIGEGRQAWHHFHLEVAELYAKRSTCLKHQVGSVVVLDNHVIAAGYNGSPSGDEHCVDHWKKEFLEQKGLACGSDQEFALYLATSEFEEKHREWSRHHEYHAEANALFDALRRGVSTEGAAIYTTRMPCLFCAKKISNAGINQVFVAPMQEHDTYHSEGERWFENHEVNVFRF